MPTVDPELMEAARSAFARHGYQQVTLEQIAAEAGVSRVTLHRRGVGKSDLLEALTVQAIADFQSAMWPVLVSQDAPRDRLCRAVDVLLEQTERHLPVIVALGTRSDAVFHEDEEAEDGADTRSVFTEALIGILTQGRQTGTLRVEDPEQTATALFNIVGWSYIHLRTGHAWSVDKAAGSVRTTVLHGLLIDA